MTGTGNRRHAQRIQEGAAAIDPGNVIPFVLPPRDDAQPPFTLEAEERPAPDLMPVSRWWRWQPAIFAGVLLVHVGLAFLVREIPDPAPAIGLQAISVELVLGAISEAGTAPAPSEEVQTPVAEEQIAKQEAKEPETPTEPEPLVSPPEPMPTPRDKKENKKQETAPPSRAASNVGRGQSRSDANYAGRVSTHLKRHFSETVRHWGSATISFSLDGGGRVTAVRVAHSSGVAAFDQEAMASVRRASPFPAPPSGRAVEFTVPLERKPK